MQQCFPAAYRRFSIRGSLQQKLFAYFLLCHGLSLHELLQFLQVFVRIKSNTLSFASISSGTSCFLIISFQTFRNIIVNDKTYVRLVNTHTEGNGRYNHFYLFHQEIVLILRACCRIHTCMVSAGVNAIRLQNFSKFFYLLPAQAVDNARLFRIVLDELDDIPIYIIGFRPYLIIEVRAVER